MNFPSNPNKKLSLPERHEMFVAAQRAVRAAENLAMVNPDDTAIKTILNSVTNILNMIRKADDRAFIQYAKELGAQMNLPDYPHSIKAWYEDEFLELLEAYNDES